MTSTAQKRAESIRKSWQTRRKYVDTPQMDQLIRDAWQSESHGKKAARQVQLRSGLGWPKWRICRRARELGLVQPRRPDHRWTAAEVATLEKFSYLGESALARKIEQLHGVRRTPAAIHLKKRRLSILAGADYFTGRALAQMLGVDEHAVTGWIQSGLLKAKPRQTERTPQQGGDQYAIFPADVRRFVRHNPTAFKVAKVEPITFFEVLLGPAKEPLS